MKLFNCNNCGQLVYFENDHCENCGLKLGFFPEQLDILPLVEEKNETFKIWGNTTATLYRYCANHEYNVCNWVVPLEDESTFCTACSFNRTIPDVSDDDYRQRWKVIEVAKHRLIYTLLRLKLPLYNKATDEETGLLFDFKAEEKNSGERIFTGHDNGLITINIAEADDIEREMARKSMDEVYRTVLGHFRHEIGHYYWDRLIDKTDHLQECRELFGDDRKSYGEALKEHYDNGAPKGWASQFISAYATMHPWEDWAETWAHYLHIIDTIETASSFGLSVHPVLASNKEFLNADININPYETEDFTQVLNLWFPLTFALNSLNRSMGLRDLYPFIIPAKVVEKLVFIHRVCRAAGKANKYSKPEKLEKV